MPAFRNHPPPLRQECDPALAKQVSPLCASAKIERLETAPPQEEERGPKLLDEMGIFNFEIITIKSID